MGSYEVFENGVSAGRTESYRPYTLLGARLNWTTGPFLLYVEGDNLLNHDVRISPLISECGPSIIVGASLTL